MSQPGKVAAALALLVACGPGGSKKPLIHLDMGTSLPDGMMMTCNQPLSLCNGGCVDYSSDVANCGSCGAACPNNQTCSNRTCSGASACSGNQVKCSGVCTDTSQDDSNCGSCGKACVNGQTCVAGQCSGGMMGGMTGCSGFLMCQQPCKDAQCFSDCFDNTNMQGQDLVNALLDCLENACPSSQGGVCDPNGDMNACTTCYTNAQSGKGACVAALNACIANKP